MSGDHQPSEPTRESAAANVEGSAGGSDQVFNESGIGYWMPGFGWLDAQAALTEGFIDGITEDEPGIGVTNAVKPRTVDRAEAEAKVQAWFDRHKPSRLQNTGDDHTSVVTPATEQAPRPEASDGTAQPSSPEDSSAPAETNPKTTDPPENSGTPLEADPKATDPPETPGTPIAQLQKRLGLIMPTRR